MNDKNMNMRENADRRSRPTPAISRYTFSGGRRKTVRRGSDTRRYLFVDRYETSLFIAAMALLMLSFLDACFTMILIDKGKVIEMNPVMSFYLEYGVIPFTIMKFFITAVSLTIFCMLKDFSVRSYCLVNRAYKNVYIMRRSLPVIINLYFMVVVYEVYLLMI